MCIKHLALAIAALTTVCLAIPDCLGQAATHVEAQTNSQIEAIRNEKQKRSPAQQKMASQLLDALTEKQTGSVNSNAPDVKAPQLTAAGPGVVVDIKAKVSDELLKSIRSLGGTVYRAYPKFNAVRASVPLESMDKLAARPDVQQISPAAKVKTNAGVATEGDIAHMAADTRSTFKVSGSGITIGVLSDSIDNGAGALQAAFDSGAIDKNTLSILVDADGTQQRGNGAGEGLAMAEIIHAIAPKAKVLFATGYGGEAQMAENILELARQGCTVIVDDLTYMNESPFQDGPISQAVAEVSANGVLYFSSARNSGNSKHRTSGTWEGDFRDGGPVGLAIGDDPKARVHVFQQEQNQIVIKNQIIKAGLRDRVDLFWADPLGGSGNDYDLFVVDAQGHVVQSSTTTHNGTQDPYQYVDHVQQGQSIVIVKAARAKNRFLHLDTGRAVLKVSTSGSVRGHNASGAPNAFSVAAIRVPTPVAGFTKTTATLVEAFSSDGPRRMFFHADGAAFTPNNFSSTGGVLLTKPDITAADGVTTTLPTASGLNPFLGTSAAAPHAAAIAALLLSCASHPTASQIRAAFERSGVPTEGVVPNITAGHGTVMANQSAQSLCATEAAAPTNTAAARIQ